jgi:hypothetical protein
MSFVWGRAIRPNRLLAFECFTTTLSPKRFVFRASSYPAQRFQGFRSKRGH